MNKYICEINNNRCMGYNKETGECITFKNCRFKKEKLMTLDEAIEHAEEVAKYSCNGCGLEHQQLADWLKELKIRREKDEKLKEYILNKIDMFER